MTPLTIREQDKEILMVVVVQEDLVDIVETKVILNSNKDKVTHKLVEWENKLMPISVSALEVSEIPFQRQSVTF